MKIAFFTEGNYRGKIDRRHAGRTDQAWIAALDATHCPIFQKLDKSVDLGIIIPPKKFDGYFTDIVNQCKLQCEKIAVMQEGDHRLFWQDRPLWQQMDYLKFLSMADILYCHNEYDQKYFRGLVQHPDVRILPTLMIEDAIPKVQLKNNTERSGTMINGNWCSWYGAGDSYFIAQEIGEPIVAPQMGRMITDELGIGSITHIPYTTWDNWMIELNKRKYAVNLMRTIAAASFSLNAAWLGIPTIGWNVQDTQRVCFPELSVPMGDMASARKVAKHLVLNELFYNHCAGYAKKMAIDIYGESQFMSRFYEAF